MIRDGEHRVRACSAIENVELGNGLKHLNRCPGLRSTVFEGAIFKWLENDAVLWATIVNESNTLDFHSPTLGTCKSPGWLREQNT